MSKCSYLGMLATSAAALFACPGASAAITSGHAGTLCVQALSTTEDIWYDHASARHINNYTMNLSCPANNQGGRVLGASVTVRDTNPGTQVSCNVQATNEADSSGFVSVTRSSGIAFMAGTIALPFPAMGVGEFFTAGSKGVYCQVGASPGMTSMGVYGYTIAEE